MKVAVLAAGFSRYFPLLIDKPKCMYHLDGEMLLEGVIESARKIVEEEKIIVVAGYKAHHIKQFLRKKYPNIKIKYNDRWRESAIFSFRKAVEGEDDDILFMLGDERIKQKIVSRIAASESKMALLTHNMYCYYSLGIFKLRRDVLELLKDDRYLSMDYIKSIYCFTNRKENFDGDFSINSGICINYILIDIIRRIGNFERIEDPRFFYHGEDLDFLYIEKKEDFLPDLDYIFQTDEYRNSSVLRIYNDFISDPIKQGVLSKLQGSLYYRAGGSGKSRKNKNCEDDSDRVFIPSDQLYEICITPESIFNEGDLLWRHMVTTNDEVLIVLSEGEVEGIVTPGDVLRCYTQGLPETEAVNRNYSFVETPDDKEKISGIFKRIPSIHMIPVIKDGRFLGLVDSGKRKSEYDWNNFRFTLEDLRKAAELSLIG